MAITKQDVFRVASEIDAEGGKASALEVRRRLGSGSYSTITAALKEWKESAEAAKEGAELSPVPAEVLEKLTLAAGDLWAVASRVALGVANEARLVWEAEKAELLEQVAAANQWADQVQADVESWRQAAHDAELLRDSLRADAQTSRGLQLAAQEAAERERKRADAVVAELTQARVQVQVQQAALDAAQRELEEFRRKFGSGSGGTRKRSGGSKSASPAASEQSAADVH
ncbi:DNA-binding protein [Azoarcus sp. DD4]|uniref:DNA-binding protein n=1 Tax=Azoarcus sp. DD4 TaxID=2027405 RepID=UPI00143D1AAF|nr:DNA-binding protein [Azoarcus sp. DD4]